MALAFRTRCTKSTLILKLPLFFKLIQVQYPSPLFCGMPIKLLLGAYPLKCLSMRNSNAQHKLPRAPLRIRIFETQNKAKFHTRVL